MGWTLLTCGLLASCNGPDGDTSSPDTARSTVQEVARGYYADIAQCLTDQGFPTTYDPDEIRMEIKADAAQDQDLQKAEAHCRRVHGPASTSSPALRTVIEDRSNGEGLVVAVPRSCSVALAGARYRSIVAALIDSSSARTSGLYLPCGSSRPDPCRASSPWRSWASSWVRIEAARYFPHCPPEAAHTRCSTLVAS